MSARLLVASFDREDRLLSAVRAARRAGEEIVEVYAPYPVHGLPEAMGLAPSRLPWVCLALGLVGLGGGLALQVWTSAFDWPLNVGGRPFASLPAFVPITFEIVVLFAGLATFLGFLFANRLRPGRRPDLPAERVTDDRFALVLRSTRATFDAEEATRRLREEHGALLVEERIG